jgi:uncharacterized membrane protein
MILSLEGLKKATVPLQRRVRDGLQARLPAVTAVHFPAIGILLVASGIACALWALRVLLHQRLHFLFLPWNLFLAWLPLLFALTALHLGRLRGWRSWKPWLAAAAWLVFFPNAPYIFTDLIHLRPTGDHRFWLDLIMILLFAWPGFVVGCLSLRMLHAEVSTRLGFLTGWLFAGATCGLAGIGVYIGRFLRWNSWDILVNPVGLGFDLLGFVGHPATHPAYRFSVLFGVLLFLGYATLRTPSPALQHK